MRNSSLPFVFLFFVFSALFSFPSPSYSAKRGFVEDAQGKNKALIIGASNGLLGIDLDVKMIREIVTHPAYNFDVNELEEANATVKRITQKLTELSGQIENKGTLFFYFSGHAKRETLLVENQKELPISKIRQAIEVGRKNKKPLERLVLVFDSCHAGSLLDPLYSFFPIFDKQTSLMITNQLFVDSIAQEFDALTGTNNQSGGASYWKKLFVFASSKAEEASFASEKGSIFTLGFKKAFQETVAKEGTIQGFISLTQEYTKKYAKEIYPGMPSHNPVARLVPESLGEEKMIPKPRS